MESEVDGEVIALDVEQGQCYGLNEVASRVWQLLEKPVSIDEISSTLVAEYAVDGNECRAQVRELIDEFVSAGLVTKA